MNITDLIGNYSIEGSNQNKEETHYSGMLTLSFLSETRLDAVWKITPDQMQYGIGFFKNDTLVVNFYYVGDDKSIYHGVISYHCNSNGVLNGVWSEEMGNPDCVGVEKAIKIQTEFLN
jgi:hypothetical protein